jgi:hypothetical protein
MAVYEKTVKKDTEAVLKKAKKYFGPGGTGLEIVSEEDCCISFEGGGGYVRVTGIDEKKGSRIELETREWDYPVKQFLDKV